MSRSKVYKDIKDRLLEQLPELEYVDLQKGQFGNKAQEYPIPLPAILIEFRPVTWSESTGGQLGDATISLYYYLDLVTDSFNNSEAENETIEILDNLDAMYDIMNGFAGDDFNPLNRLTDAIVEYKDKYVCYRTDFQTTLFQDKPATQETAPKPEPKFKL